MGLPSPALYASKRLQFGFAEVPEGAVGEIAEEEGADPDPPERKRPSAGRFEDAADFPVLALEEHDPARCRPRAFGRKGAIDDASDRGTVEKGGEERIVEGQIGGELVFLVHAAGGVHELRGEIAVVSEQ